MMNSIVSLIHLLLQPIFFDLQHRLFVCQCDFFVHDTIYLSFESLQLILQPVLNLQLLFIFFVEGVDLLLQVTEFVGQ